MRNLLRFDQVTRAFYFLKITTFCSLFTLTLLNGASVKAIESGKGPIEDVLGRDALAQVSGGAGSGGGDGLACEKALGSAGNRGGDLQDGSSGGEGSQDSSSVETQMRKDVFRVYGVEWFPKELRDEYKYLSGIATDGLLRQLKEHEEEGLFGERAVKKLKYILPQGTLNPKLQLQKAIKNALDRGSALVLNKNVIGANASKLTPREYIFVIRLGDQRYLVKVNELYQEGTDSSKYVIDSVTLIDTTTPVGRKLMSYFYMQAAFVQDIARINSEIFDGKNGSVKVQVANASMVLRIFVERGITPEEIVEAIISTNGEEVKEGDGVVDYFADRFQHVYYRVGKIERAGYGGRTQTVYVKVYYDRITIKGNQVVLKAFRATEATVQDYQDFKREVSPNDHL